MDAALTISQLISLGAIVTVLVTFAMLAILRLWPEFARIDSHNQGLRVKELTARCDQLEGQNRLLLSKLVEAAVENGKLQKRVREVEVEIITARHELKVVREQLEEQHIITPISITNTPVLVAVGNDAKLKIDIASLRGVEVATGLAFRRIENATFDKIKTHLDRARKARRPYDKLHLSVHSSAEGIVLGEENIGGVELSEILRGIKILVIAGCESSEIGDSLGVVPFVVTITERIAHEDAAIFTENFWMEIGKLQSPQVAFETALEYSPPSLMEFVEYHWR